jgi:hypothetical protein
MLDRPPPARRLALVDPAAERRAQEAERKRRWRARQKAGGAVLPVPIADLNALIATVLDLGWLPVQESEDRRAIAKAVGALLDDLAASWRRENG